MGIEKLENIRRNGKYYTPELLAECLAKPLIRETTKFVFDPAYGDGALLLAADRIAQKQPINSFIELYGCDKAPVNGLLQKIPASQLVKENFFRYKPEKKFDVILMNPPYVRHHLMSESAWSLYQKATNKILQLNSYSDLWAYFLIKATQHLKKSGSIGAILPWSFLQAEYAQMVRVWLANNFGRIKVLALGASYFDAASERVLLLWLEDYGTSAKEIRYGYSYQIDPKIGYFSIDKKAWEAQAVAVSSKESVESILQTYIDKHSFARLRSFAEVKIGVVTGADEYFIVRQEQVNELNLPVKYLVPILKSSREFNGLIMNGIFHPHRLLVFHPSIIGKVHHYVRIGKKMGYDQRSHSRRRNPWFFVDPGAPPDAFFPCRCSHTPYFVVNNHKVQCTNSIHRIYFYNRLSEEQMKWLQITSLSVPGQLSIEAYSKVYGEGVLKIEPKSLKEAIVHISERRIPQKIYTQILNLIRSNQRKEAVEVATRFVDSVLEIPKELSNNARLILSELQARRIPMS